MKRLFQLTLANGKPYSFKYKEEGDRHTRTHIPYYDNKQHAKEDRDFLNSNGALPDNLLPIRVSIGPDHWRYKGGAS